MMPFLLFISLLLAQEVIVPFKPNDEFQMDIEYKFKVRPTTNHSITEFNGQEGGFDRKINKGGPLPYLMINFKILKLNENEVRIKGTNNRGNNVVHKKVEKDMVIKLDLGFTDDMKDQVTANEYMLFFLNEDRKEVSVVKLVILQDGTFVVNDEVRGKF